MEASPQKRILTDAAFQDRKLPRTAATQFLSDELIAQLANVGRRVRYNVSQGYASNRTTPMSTPYGSPVKPIPTNPSNTPQTSPVRFSIFRTEHEIIHEAAGELENVHLDSTSTGTKQPASDTNPTTKVNVDLVEKMMAVGESSPRKRRRAAHDEDYYSGTEYSSPNDGDNYSEEEDEDDGDDDYNPRNKSKSKSKQPKRSLKALPKAKRARRPAPFAEKDGPSEKNPFLV